MWDSRALAHALTHIDPVVDEWLVAYKTSQIRLPVPVDASLRSMLRPVLSTLSDAVSADREGRWPVLELTPGCLALREVEKSISFLAANLAAYGFTAFDVCALFFALRDVLKPRLADRSLYPDLRTYMEWLAALASDSLAKARERAAQERWDRLLDNGMPLVMITPELPAAFFLCDPIGPIITSLFERLLLMIVRTGAKSAILEVSGLDIRVSDSFAVALEHFCLHNKVRNHLTIFACGVHADEIERWKTVANSSGTNIVFENHFDMCVEHALRQGGHRILPFG